MSPPLPQYVVHTCGGWLFTTISADLDLGQSIWINTEITSLTPLVIIGGSGWGSPSAPIPNPSSSMECVCRGRAPEENIGAEDRILHDDGRLTTRAAHHVTSAKGIPCQSLSATTRGWPRCIAYQHAYDKHRTGSGEELKYLNWLSLNACDNTTVDQQSLLIRNYGVVFVSRFLPNSSSNKEYKRGNVNR
ncbi:hypothetical protein ACRALDRAFT_209015 [Sodiomyces alcalophilus JCM 7366]|uniref:uncharacterized protein n=1 Tax=Sodiomyces alcalophilus JCM 7366 TaxID=591952 RepID=UPI0039B4187F